MLGGPYFSSFIGSEHIFRGRDSFGVSPHGYTKAHKTGRSLRPHVSILPHAMLLLRFLSVSLAFLCSALCAFCSDKGCSCKKPAIRREWRTLSAHEKAQWIRAVNVCICHSLQIDVMLMPSFNSDCSACHTCRMTQLWPHQLTLRYHKYPQSTRQAPIMMV